MKLHISIPSLLKLLLTLIIYLWSPLWGHAQDILQKEKCTFTIGAGSSYSGTYVVEIDEDNAFGYNDFENKQYVIEINGNNDITIMLILEGLAEGKHVFSMEMQASFDISKDGGDNYVNFSNYRENGGGYIEINKIDKDNKKIAGSFSGIFHEDTAPEDVNVELSGSFIVKME